MTIFEMAAARQADPFAYDPFTPFLASPPVASATLTCGNCGRVTNPTYGQSVAETIALAVAVGGISKACPQCGVWYKVGEFVERFNPQAGRAIKNVAFAVGVVMMLTGLLGGRR